MSDSDSKPRQAPLHSPRLLRGLDEQEAERLAVDLLGSIPWNGVELDPETTLAGAFLSSL